MMSHLLRMMDGVLRVPFTDNTPPVRDAGSNHLDLIGEDRQVRRFHDRVLGQLLGMIGRRAALQDQPVGVDEQTKIADAVAQAALNVQLQPIASCLLRQNDGFFNDIGVHGDDSK